MLWLSLIVAATVPVGPYDASWAQSLRPGSTVHLPAGLYSGPWRLGAGVHLIADPGAALQARQSGAPALVIGGPGVTVEGLTVQAAPGAIGIEATGRSRLTLLDVHIEGGTRGLEIVGGDLSWTGGSVAGSSDYGVRAKQAHLSLRGVQFRENHGPALYLADTQVEISHCGFASSEYGILGFHDQVDVVESDFSKLKQAAVGLSRSSGRLADNHFVGPSDEAAISILGAPSLRIERNRIERPGSAGIKLLNSTATLAGNSVSGARADKSGLEGNGLYLYASHVQSHGDSFMDNGGSSLAVLGGTATLTDCRIERCGQTPAYVGNRGALELLSCTIAGSSSDLDIEVGATLRTDGTRFLGTGDKGFADGGQ